MNPRALTLLTMAVLVAIAFGAFLWLDIHVAANETTAESTASTYSFGGAGGERLSLEREVDLYVDGPPALAATLADQLMASLGDNPFVGRVNLRTGRPRAAEHAVLVVDLGDPRFLATPVYGRADMAVELAYASDGRVDWIDEQVIRSTNESGLTVRVRGHYELSNTAYGLLTLPGYRSLLAREIAAQLGVSLQSRLEDVGG